MRSGVDVLDATIVQIDRQRDPRCILVAADIVDALGEVGAKYARCGVRPALCSSTQLHAAPHERVCLTSFKARYWD